MIAETEKISDTRIAFRIEVDAKRVDEALDRAYRKVAQRVNVPGFRKGRVPRKILEARFGKEVLYEDALEELVPEAYEEAVRQSEAEVIDQPEVSDVEIEAGSPLRFRAEVDIMPEAKLGEYKGLKVEKLVEKVEESDIDHMLWHLQEENAELVAVDRDQVEKGDFVTLDFEGYLDGQPFPGGAATGYTLEVGSGQFVEGFEEQLIGAKVGEETEIKVTFPDDYHSEELKGKEVTFKVKVHTLKVRQLPELDDEFAADVSDADTLEGLRAQIRQEMEEAAERRADREMRDRLVALVRDAATVEIPEVLVRRELEDSLNDFARTLYLQGVDPNQYLVQTGQTVDSLREQLRPDAERRVKNSIVLRTIAKREGVTVTEEEVDAHIERMVESSNNPEATRQTWTDPDRRSALERSLVLDKVVDLLVSSAEVEVKEVPSQGHGHRHHHDDHDDEHHHDHEGHEQEENAADDS